MFIQICFHLIGSIVQTSWWLIYAFGGSLHNLKKFERLLDVSSMQLTSLDHFMFNCKLIETRCFCTNSIWIICMVDEANHIILSLQKIKNSNVNRKSTKMYLYFFFIIENDYGFSSDEPLCRFLISKEISISKEKSIYQNHMRIYEILTVQEK